ncbi:tyrosine-protein phosphatase non-receptor type 22 isoform X2 [Cottoperca gobio]|uniref:protein-tyrosine-phosphatase n=1 Tax=Cottoperca gobio TaxID=56716 RepID=A0A6J2P7L5_COTGO|nr:tyrosine-protein phosphatase non-receptor type 22-like isoform X2 [Cottoperca gobio]
MEQQARILRSFLAQLERQEAADEQASNGIAGEFARLRSQSTKYRSDRTFPTKTAEKQENAKKNRYKDIVPFDHTRVKLTLTTAKDDTEYINASFIKGMSGSRAYIATQGPLPHTVLDFLRMLWEYNVKVVVMACREVEMGKKKCERYWPQKQEQPFFCEPFSVYCDSEENKGDYLTRTLRVIYGNCSRTVKQLHYFNWPDHGVPDSIPPILDMLHEMRSYQAHDDVPFCIHCSAGCGRTGALCVIDYTWNLLKKQMISPDFNIYDIVQNMRTQRPSVVQTKVFVVSPQEQYELVYRTIRLLFERYLQWVEAETRRHEMAMVPSTITPDPESELSDLSDELDLLPHFQHLLGEEWDVSPQLRSDLPSAAEHHIALRAMDLQREQEQWRLHPEALTSTQELQEGPRSPRAVEEKIQQSDIPSMNPSPFPVVAAAICLMVEDPYFDTPIGSPSSQEAALDATLWTVSSTVSAPSLLLNDLELHSAAGKDPGHSDEEDPPPLPQRTPESFEMAAAAEHSDPSQRLMVIIPPNAAAEAVRELGGNPPSPVPPLPERTPESFEFGLDQAPVEQRSEVTPAVNLSRIGKSSEWSTASASHTDTKPWLRSKSMKAKMTFTVTHPEVASSPTPHPHCPPLTPPLLPQTEESLTPPLPDRTPESFVLPTEEPVQEKPFPLTSRPPPQVGLSSEWDGTAQPKRFLDVVMSRSKSVRAKGSRQVEPLTAFWQLAPPAVAVAGAGSAAGQQDVQCRPSLNPDTSGNKSEKRDEKGVSRSRSLKLFRHKQKPKTAPPPPVTQPGTSPPSNGASSVFKLDDQHDAELQDSDSWEFITSLAHEWTCKAPKCLVPSPALCAEDQLQ